MKQLLVFLLLFLLFYPAVKAQTICITDEVNAGIHSQEETFNASVKKQGIRKAGTVRVIPVVFHVLFRNDNSNISDTQIINALDILNQNFRRLNANAAQTRGIFKGVAADMEIEFRLARKDPQGNCTNGIVRLFDEEATNGSDSIKKKSYWPSDRYLNIWVLENITHPTFGKIGITGYSQYPWINRPETDGITIISNGVGNIGTGNPNMASYLTHEAGHWLGCYHTFNDSCTGGDLVDDTPPCASNRFSIFACDTTKNTCSNDNPDLPDQIENYMDYAIGSCQNMFTIGQKMRMDATLNTLRTNIWSQQNLVATGTDKPTAISNCKPLARFIAKDNLQSQTSTVCATRTLVFYNQSYNYASTPNYQWIFDGGSPATSTLQNPIVTYATEGTYTVTLIVSSPQGSDTLVKQNYVEVLPTASPRTAPFVQDFEGVDFRQEGWSIKSNTYTNFILTDVGTGTVLPNSSNTLYIDNNERLLGSEFNLYSPSFDISNLQTPVLSFYYAMALRPKGSTFTSNDRLVVYYSTDCGQNWQPLWDKIGKDLSTLNTGNGTTFPFAPSDPSKWRQVVIPLPTSINKQNVRFMFRFISDGGNNFYIDAINIGFPSSAPTIKVLQESLTVYPNPTHGTSRIDLQLSKHSKLKLSVTDILGREIALITNGEYETGTHSFYYDFSGTKIINSLLFINAEVNGNILHKKILYVE